MSGAGPVATAGSSTAVSDPRSLVLHLEVCRLQAELERLEGRLADLRANDRGAPGRGGAADEAPAADDADEVIDRMVATLLESGRSDIALAATARQEAADERLQLDRARAAAIVASARAELDKALADRGQALQEGWEAGFDVVVLADRDDPAPVAPTPDIAVPDTAEPALLADPVEITPVPEPTWPAAAEVEEARTDAAFDAWLAVAPGAPVDDLVDPVEQSAPVIPLAEASPVTAPVSPEAETDSETLTPGPGAPNRSRWLLPLEVVGALLAAAILVVLVLVLVG